MVCHKPAASNVQVAGSPERDSKTGSKGVQDLWSVTQGSTKIESGVRGGGYGSPYGHYGCFAYVDLDGSPPLLPLKHLHLSLKLILSGLILLNLTRRRPYLLLSLKRILY